MEKLGAFETFLLVSVIAIPVAMATSFGLAGPRLANRIKWAVFGALFWPVVLLVVSRRLRGRDADGNSPQIPAPPPASSPQKEPVPVPSVADLENVPPPFSACPECGYLGIRPPGLMDGVWPGGGELQTYVCPRCPFRGSPVIFRHPAAYVQFVRELHSPEPPATPP